MRCLFVCLLNITTKMVNMSSKEVRKSIAKPLGNLLDTGSLSVIKYKTSSYQSLIVLFPALFPKCMKDSTN